MSTLKDLRAIRLQKLDTLRAKGIDPYPAKSFKNIANGDVTQKFVDLEGTLVTVAGRIMSIREHGKLSFIDLKDATGKIQLYIKPGALKKPDYSKSELGMADLTLLDLGDFAEATGKVVKTKSGEISVEVSSLRILVKSLRPLPDSWDGLKDKETRLRRRYVDTNVNDAVYQRFIRRAKFWQAHRDFFREYGFIEMDVPILEHIPGGGDATPFVTHMDAIDEDFYLRIAQELYLKRLVGGGYEKVFEIGPRFRNEGLSDEHLPEHIAMEFYWAYADWEQGMHLVKELLDYVIAQVYGDKKVFNIRGFEVDFSKDWRIIDFGDVIKEHFDIDVYDVSLEDAIKTLETAGIRPTFQLNIPRIVDALWKHLRKDIAGPAFLVNHPKYLSPLQKPSSKDPRIVERFQPIIAGSELGNGWSEVNDALEQFDRFSEQQKMRDAGDTEAQWLDIDYVEMLEYGMPPTFGYGHSERTFWFLEDVSAREGVPFPQLKFYLSDVTREIYGLEDFEKIPVSKLQEATPEEASPPIALSITKKEAHDLLDKHVRDDYQRLHARMVAHVMQAYAKKLGEDENLWFITGLLHDLDYYEYPDDHPHKEVSWFKEWGYPEDLIHAVEAHGYKYTGIEPSTKLAAALVSVDELCGFLYAYSLMRPTKFEGMNAKSAVKKFKDKGFAAKVSREEVLFGVQKLGIDLAEHFAFVIEVLKEGVVC